MPARSLRSASILAVGSELTTGSTRDTNSGQLAAELSGIGVEVLQTVALPDRLERVADAFRAALTDADLVVSTGGLGPTPDDLTREAIAEATGLELRVDPELERWLRVLFRRRRVEMPRSNLKQAWLVPGATPLRNDNGTAPGWWLEVGSGQLVVALPGPPREMWPMWQFQVRPRMLERGVGGEMATETLRLTGIGESALVELIGEEMLRRREPEVATYARPDAVDLRITARGNQAPARVEQAVADLLGRVGKYVFARGDEGWPEVLGRALAGRTLAVLEIGSGGQVTALLGGEPWLIAAQLMRPAVPTDLQALAAEARSVTGADVGMAVRATEREVETRVEIALSDDARAHTDERKAFLAGPEGRRRAALAACGVLWEWLRDDRETGAVR